MVQTITVHLEAEDGSLQLPEILAGGKDRPPLAVHQEAEDGTLQLPELLAGGEELRPITVHQEAGDSPYLTAT